MEFALYERSLERKTELGFDLSGSACLLSFCEVVGLMLR